jgi:hypothetical protein
MITTMPSRQSRLERNALAGLGQDIYSYEYDAYSDPGAVTQPAITAPESDWSTWLTQAVKIYTEYDLQKEVMDINLARAQQGLPPLDLSRYGAGVQVGVSAQTQTMILMAVGIIAAAMLLPKMLRGR